MPSGLLTFIEHSGFPTSCRGAKKKAAQTALEEKARKSLFKGDALKGPLGEPSSILVEVADHVAESERLIRNWTNGD